MEEKYKNELKNLRFTADPESIGTVLQMSAYHNTYNDVTDRSYAVINMPRCHENEIEKSLLNAVFKILSFYYRKTVKLEHFGPSGGAPCVIRDNSIQLTFSWALTAEEITKKTVDLLKMGLKRLNDDYKKLDPEDSYIRNKQYANTLVRSRIKTILTFIRAGSVSYEMIDQSYDPLD